VIFVNLLLILYLDESDEEDDGLPKRKRRYRAERAAEGMDVEDDDKVNTIIFSILKNKYIN